MQGLFRFKCALRFLCFKAIYTTDSPKRPKGEGGS